VNKDGDGDSTYIKKTFESLSWGLTISGFEASNRSPLVPVAIAVPGGEAEAPCPPGSLERRAGQISAQCPGASSKIQERITGSSRAIFHCPSVKSGAAIGSPLRVMDFALSSEIALSATAS
jgi:hypothetical protein